MFFSISQPYNSILHLKGHRTGHTVEICQAAIFEENHQGSVCKNVFIHLLVVCGGQKYVIDLFFHLYCKNKGFKVYSSRKLLQTSFIYSNHARFFFQNILKDRLANIMAARKLIFRSLQSSAKRSKLKKMRSKYCQSTLKEVTLN